MNLETLFIALSRHASTQHYLSDFPATAGFLSPTRFPLHNRTRCLNSSYTLQLFFLAVSNL